MSEETELIAAIGAYLIFLSGLAAVAFVIYFARKLRRIVNRIDKVLGYVEEEETNRRL